MIGSGAVGVEFASIFKSFGAEVTVSNTCRGWCRRGRGHQQGTRCVSSRSAASTSHLGAKVDKVEKTKDGVMVSFTSSDGKPQTKQAEKVLVAVGRAPRTDDIGLDKTKIKLERGFVYDQRMDGDDGAGRLCDWRHRCRAAAAGARRRAMAAWSLRRRIAGQVRASPSSASAFRRCTYCEPQIASVGLTEAQAKEKGLTVKVGKFPFVGNSKATIVERTTAS